MFDLDVIERTLAECDLTHTENTECVSEYWYVSPEDHLLSRAAVLVACLHVSLQVG